MDEANVSRVVRRVVKRAGLPAFRLYDLRHIFASPLLAAGTKPGCSRRGGRASTRF
jgi:integrase